MSASLLGQQSYKVVLLGEGSVGKTSMARRYVENRFDANVARTSNASYLERSVPGLIAGR